MRIRITSVVHREIPDVECVVFFFWFFFLAHTANAPMGRVRRDVVW